MTSRFCLAVVLAACAVCLRAETFYQIDLSPTGVVIARDNPVWKGSTLVFRRYPDGAVMSVRKADVKKVSQISRAEELLTPAERVVQIGNLAMQGGSAQAGPTNASAATVKSAPVLGKGFYSGVVPGQTTGAPNSPNDYVVGRTFAGPPPNAVQTSPGAPPTMPAATGGAKPPQ